MYIKNKTKQLTCCSRAIHNHTVPPLLYRVLTCLIIAQVFPPSQLQLYNTVRNVLIAENPDSQNLLVVMLKTHLNCRELSTWSRLTWMYTTAVKTDILKCSLSTANKQESMQNKMSTDHLVLVFSQIFCRHSYIHYCSNCNNLYNKNL